MSGEGKTAQGRRYREGGVKQISQLLGNVREYREGYKEGVAGGGRGQNPDTDTVRIV